VSLACEHELHSKATSMVRNTNYLSTGSPALQTREKGTLCWVPLRDQIRWQPPRWTAIFLVGCRSATLDFMRYRARIANGPRYFRGGIESLILFGRLSLPTELVSHHSILFLGLLLVLRIAVVDSHLVPLHMLSVFGCSREGGMR